MIKFITLHSDGLSLMISLIALLVAIYSVIYTHIFNRRDLCIDEVYIDSSEEYPLIFLCINNVSPVSVKICNVVFKNHSGEVIEPLDYIPEPKPYKIPEFNSPLRQTTTLEPHNDLEVSYFFRNADEVANVTVYCKERIHRLRRYRTFPLNPMDVD